MRSTSITKEDKFFIEEALRAVYPTELMGFEFGDGSDYLSVDIDVFEIRRNHLETIMGICEQTGNLVTITPGNGYINIKYH